MNLKKIKRFVSKRIVFPLATLKWKLFHPKILPRLGMKFIIDPQVVPYYITNKKTFQRLLPLFDFFVNENSIVLDIGASFGFYSIYSSKIRNAKKVIAFEIERTIEPYWQEQGKKYLNVEIVWEIGRAHV